VSSIKEVESLEEYCNRSHSPISFYYKDKCLKEFWNTPKTIGDHDPEYLKYFNLKYESKKTYVAEIKNPKIEGLNNRGSINLYSENGEKIKDISSVYSHKNNFKENVCLKGSSVLMNADSGSEFFHWMYHIIPKVYLIEKWSSSRFENISNIIFPKDIKSKYCKESIKKLKIPEDKIFKLGRNSSVTCENLIIPSRPGRHIYVCDWVYEFLRKNFLKEDKKYFKKIYISRARAKGRYLENENDLMKYIKPLGFKKIFMEDYDLYDQANLFNYAEEIICPHGAALSNLAYCKPGTKIFELFNSNYVLPLYWSISNDLGLNYHYMVYQDNEEVNKPNRKWKNINLNIDKFAFLYE
tara:strand:+ start:985 stop:2043 length:1059 start_codon:yes stop_codon:yes gene_type:complete